MAYIVKLMRLCCFGNCTRNAKVEVFNRVNTSIGAFCTLHGQRALAEQERRERDS